MDALGLIRQGPAPFPDEAPCDRAWRTAMLESLIRQLGLPWPQPPSVCRRGAPRYDDLYRDELYAWLRRHVKLLEEGMPDDARLPPVARPANWRPGMCLELLPEPGAEPEPVPEVEPPDEPAAKRRREYHREKKALRYWVVDYANLRKQMKFGVTATVEHLHATFPGVFGPWVTPRLVRDWVKAGTKGQNDERMLLMPFLEVEVKKLVDAGIPTCRKVLLAIAAQVAEQQGLQAHLNAHKILITS